MDVMQTRNELSRVVHNAYAATDRLRLILVFAPASDLVGVALPQNMHETKRHHKRRDAMMIKAWVAAIAASVVTLGLAGCGTPNDTNGPPQPSVAGKSISSQPLIRPVQHNTECWDPAHEVEGIPGAVTQGWEDIYSVCRVLTSNGRDLYYTAYIYNKTPDRVLFMTATRGSRYLPVIGTTPDNMPKTSDELVTYIASRMTAARPALVGILVPPGGYASTTGSVDIFIDHPRSQVITVLRYAVGLAARKLAPESLVNQIVGCANSSIDIWGKLWDEANSSPRPLTKSAIVYALLKMKNCEDLFSGISTWESIQNPPIPKLDPGKKVPTERVEQVVTLLDKETKINTAWENLGQYILKFARFSPRG
ncbi:hypothetical protein ACW9HH_14950 [Nocardia gipuzkoensis]